VPLYRCMVTEGLTSYDQRAAIAEEVTRIHCEVTGAPATFVHTFFAEDADGELPEGTRALIFGSIRAGRMPEQKQRLVSEMKTAVSTILGISEGEAMLATADMPARWVMEGGELLPEPGEEEAWLARHG
jgi:phenylpyruvate tautomerase PptA (4-oxalocrotonate tautomerase family)